MLYEVITRPWDSVSAEQKILSDYRMAVYAAQIYCIDYNVGKLVASLKAQNKLDNRNNFV